MDTNGFVELGLRSELDSTLAAIARQLGGLPPTGPTLATRHRHAVATPALMVLPTPERSR